MDLNLTLFWSFYSFSKVYFTIYLFMLSYCIFDYGWKSLQNLSELHYICRAQRGKQLSLTIRFSNQGRSFDDTEVWTHANDTLGSVRRQILTRCVNLVLLVLSYLVLFLSFNTIKPLYWCKTSSVTSNFTLSIYLTTTLFKVGPQSHCAWFFTVTP